MFTHRSFRSPPAVRALLAVLGSMAGQHHLFLWVSTHRRHHQFTDRPGDPHSPRVMENTRGGRWRAFAHAHWRWILSDRLTDADLSSIPDLTSDARLCRIQRAYVGWLLLGLALPAAACYAVSGTWQSAVGGLLWGGFFRMFVSSQFTWCVNSIGHTWGSRRFETSDTSRNNLAIALLCLGDGWHNNHHAFPTSARHGLDASEPDLGWFVIRMLRRLGWAWDIKMPTAEQIAARTPPPAPRTADVA